MKDDRNIEVFLSDSQNFINKFESKFVDYFISLSLSYDKLYSKDILDKAARIVYKDVFDIDIFVTTLEEEIFDDMREDGIIIGFIISRSMLFLLENYIKDEAIKQKNSTRHIETLVLFISEYISQFEKQINDKNRVKPLHINFDTIENFSAGKNIIDIFEEIKHKGEKVTFFNLYEGLPIIHSAVIMDIEDDEISFRTEQAQEIAMKLDGVAYILKDNNFDKYIKADIVYNNFSNSTVVLSNFTYLLNMPATQREFIRVHPGIMAKVTLMFESDLTTEGKLFDLSVDGIGVISEENNGIYAGAKIQLNFSLNVFNIDGLIDIIVEGEVLNIIEYSDSFRYCIKIFPKDDILENIERYVKLREVEIIDNLKKELDEYKF